MANWYYNENGEKRGPISSAELRSRTGQGLLKHDDYVCREGMSVWVVAKQVPEFFPDTASSPPPQSSPLPPPLKAKGLIDSAVELQTCPRCASHVSPEARECPACQFAVLEYLGNTRLANTTELCRFPGGQKHYRTLFYKND